MQDAAASTTLLGLAVGCCLCAAFAAAEEATWLRALDVALASARRDGEVARACSLDDDPELRARVLRRHPGAEGEVLVSGGFLGTQPALHFRGRVVCLDCVRRAL